MKKYIRKNSYRWHRISSLIIALPVLLWTVSGFLHPVMNSFKPAVKSQSIVPWVLDTAQIKTSLAAALQQNNIAGITGFRIVKVEGNYYYQLTTVPQKEKQYLSCLDGTPLKGGDAFYAEYLAQQFLTVAGSASAHQHHGENHFKQVANVEAEKVTVTEVKQLKQFDNEYKGSQKILPVYKVSFNRQDDIRLYVETATDKMVYAVDAQKAAFSRFFSLAHSWSFLNGLGKVKSAILGTVSFLCLVSAVCGFYIYNISSAKKKSAVQKRSWAKKTHRLTGNVFLVTTLLYAFSGGWHAFKKVADSNDKKAPRYEQSFTPGELNFSCNHVAQYLKPNESWNNLAAVKMDNEIYWVLTYLNQDKKPEKRYISQATGHELKGGDQCYAQYVAAKASGRTDVKAVKNIKAFNHEYSMMNKRLPVVQVTYQNGKSYFVETATGTVAAIVSSANKAERFSFSNLHMHHYAEKSGGKAAQNTILITTTLGLLLVACTGTAIYLKRRFF